MEVFRLSFGFLRKQRLRQGFEDRITCKEWRTLIGEQEGTQKRGSCRERVRSQARAMVESRSFVPLGAWRARAEHTLPSYPHGGRGPGVFTYRLPSASHWLRAAGVGRGTILLAWKSCHTHIQGKAGTSGLRMPTGRVTCRPWQLDHQVWTG